MENEIVVVDVCFRLASFIFLTPNFFTFGLVAFDD